MFHIDVLDANVTALVQRMHRRDIGVKPVVEQLLLDNFAGGGTSCQNRGIEHIPVQRGNDIGRYHLFDL